MSTPLTDGINALTAYANEVTSASDTTLSDAVGRLCEGYGTPELWKTVVLEEAYEVENVTTLGFWMSFLEIPQQDILDGYTYFVRFIGNSTVRNYSAIFAIYMPNDEKTDLYPVGLRVNREVQALIGYDKWMYAKAGTTIKVYRFALP